MSKIKLFCTVFLLSTTIGIIAMKQPPLEKVNYSKLVSNDTLKITELHAPPKSLTLEVNEFNKNVVKFEKIKKELLSIKQEEVLAVQIDTNSALFK